MINNNYESIFSISNHTIVRDGTLVYKTQKTMD